MPPPSRTEARDAAVLAAIQARAAPDPAAQIPIADLAGDIGASVDTARRSVRRLVGAGRLEVFEQRGPWGGDAPQLYRPTSNESITDREPCAERSDTRSITATVGRHAGQTLRSRSVDAVPPPGDTACAR